MAERDQHWLQMTLDAHMSKVDTPRLPDGHFHASAIVSDAGYACDRYLAYTLYYLSPRSGTLDPKTARIFRVGEDLHASLQREMYEAGVLVLHGEFADDKYRKYEHPFRKAYPPIKGSADAVLKKPYSEMLFVGEFKSMNTTQFSTVLRPLAKHIAQLNIYEGCLEIHQGIFVYENKDNQDQKFWDHQFDSASWDTLMARLSKIYDNYVKGVLPPRIGEKVCDGCPFLNNICKGRLAHGSDYVQPGDVHSSLVVGRA